MKPNENVDRPYSNHYNNHGEQLPDISESHQQKVRFGYTKFLSFIALLLFANLPSFGIATADYQKQTTTDAYFEQQFIAALPEDSFFNTSDWMVGVILFSTLLLALTNLFFGKQLRSTISSLFNSWMSGKLYADRNALSQRVADLLTFIFVINGGLFLYQILVYSNIHLINLPGFFTFLLLSFALFLFIQSKKYTLIILGFIFNKQKLFTEYNYYVFLYYKAIGIALFPVIIGLPFTAEHFNPIFIYLSAFVISISYLLRYSRGFRIILHKQVSFFYLILYLCALEIAPVLIVFKFVNSLS